MSASLILYALAVLLLLLLFPLLLCVILVLLLRLQTSRRCHGRLRIGFLHPHCYMGGGGEHVLWKAVGAVSQTFPVAEIVVYAAREELEASPSNASDAVRRQMGVKVAETVHLVGLKWNKWAEAERYGRLTLLLQTLGGAILGFEALRAHPVDIFVDTAGHSFAVLIAKLSGLTTVSYVHYPVISTDMLSIVRKRQVQFNNSEDIARSRLLSSVKLVYYKLFAMLYGFAGRMNDFTMVNSTWTYRHIESIWGRMEHLCIVYPPCSVSELMKIDLQRQRKQNLILSIGQFRPEKNHMMQLDALKSLLETRGAKVKDIRLVIVGGARDKADRTRASTLMERAKEMGLVDNVEVKVNVSRSDISQLLEAAHVGIHTMRDEHFGISVVEFMAAGVIAIAHNSGGVCADIIDNGQNGYLASDAQEYADHIFRAVFTSSHDEQVQIQKRARHKATTFSDEHFRYKFASIIRSAIDVVQKNARRPTTWLGECKG